MGFVFDSGNRNVRYGAVIIIENEADDKSKIRHGGGPFSSLRQSNFDRFTHGDLEKLLKGKGYEKVGVRVAPRKGAWDVRTREHDMLDVLRAIYDLGFLDNIRQINGCWVHRTQVSRESTYPMMIEVEGYHGEKTDW